MVQDPDHCGQGVNTLLHPSHNPAGPRQPNPALRMIWQRSVSPVASPTAASSLLRSASRFQPPPFAHAAARQLPPNGASSAQQPRRAKALSTAAAGHSKGASSPERDSSWASHQDGPCAEQEALSPAASDAGAINQLGMCPAPSPADYQGTASSVVHTSGIACCCSPVNVMIRVFFHHAETTLAGTGRSEPGLDACSGTHAREGAVRVCAGRMAALRGAPARALVLH